jgi:abortive infection bacteriophage resistance protein
MGKIATSVEFQISKLKDRGMIMDLGDEKAKEILLDIGHYRLGFYRNPFEIDSEHNLKKGTKFSEVLALYYMDVDLRHLLIKYLNRIETNFKTNLIYYISNEFKKDNKWFVNPKVVTIDFIEGRFKTLSGGIKSDYRVGGFKKKIYTESFKKNNLPIRNHHKNNKGCDYAPAWKTIEFLTFGQTITIYKSLVDIDNKQYLSKIYGIESVSKFGNYLNTLVDLRNSCAHGNVLFDYHTKDAISSLPFLKIEKEKNHSLGACFKVLTFFINTISSNRKDDFLLELRELFNSIKKQYPQNSKTINETIINKMKYNV